MNRRQLITGLISLVAAPAIVRAGSLMPVKMMLAPVTLYVGSVPLSSFGRRDGLSLETAFETIQEAINKAFSLPQSVVTIQIAQGTYIRPFDLENYP